MSVQFNTLAKDGNLLANATHHKKESFIMDKLILTAFTTGKPVRLHAMTMKEFTELLNAIKGSK